jgi:hypothetical protein
MNALSGLEVGEITDDAALTSLDAFINSCASGVEEAQELLADMGVDAEVESVPYE